MKIAVTGYAHPFGNNTYYGAERQIWYLMNELKKLGHEVVVFSVEGCNLPGFEYVKLPIPWKDDVDIYWEAIKEYEKANGSFDFIHSYQASGMISEQMRGDHKRYCLEPFFGFGRFPNNIISYSAKLNNVNGGQGTVIYFGLPQEKYPAIEEVPGDYLVWIGRMDMGKAPDIAIEVAKRTGQRLVLMGPSYHYPYFVDKIWPHVDGEQIIWLRAVEDEVKQMVFRKAKGFLSTNWDHYHEMFGIVNIEALASGCPVIGWGHKTQPSAINFEGGEIITHGKEGFIVEYNDYTEEEREKSIQQACEYVTQLSNIDRMACHNSFKWLFTAELMTKKHEVYYKLVKERGIVHNLTNEVNELTAQQYGI
jgi:glycosyltransferase involved in cell wall biosynthesis